MTANGFPKSGNHALVKALELLGIPARVNHLPFGAAVDEPHVFIKRDPRDVVVSALRFKHRQVTAGTYIAQFRRFELDPKERSLVAAMAEFEPWLTRAYVVRYEELIADEAQLRGLQQIYSDESVRVRSLRAHIKELRQQLLNLSA